MPIFLESSYILDMFYKHIRQLNAEQSFDNAISTTNDAFTLTWTGKLVRDA